MAVDARYGSLPWRIKVTYTMSDSGNTYEKDQRVRHHQYGTGRVVRSDNTSASIMVDFDRRGNHIVDERDLTPAQELLRDVTIDEKPEWQDEAVSEHEAAVYGGEVEINLNFTDDVACDVDVHDDGRIIVQYWNDE